MSRWLSDEWFDQTRTMSEGQPDRPGLTGRMQYEITGGPNGDISYFWILEDGHLRESGLGQVDDADVTLTTEWADALSIHRGVLDPNVAFMQGKMKVAGSMGLMMRLLPVTNSPEYQDLRRQIVAITEF